MPSCVSQSTDGGTGSSRHEDRCDTPCLGCACCIRCHRHARLRERVPHTIPYCYTLLLLCTLGYPRMLRRGYGGILTDGKLDVGTGDASIYWRHLYTKHHLHPVQLCAGYAATHGPRDCTAHTSVSPTRLHSHFDTTGCNTAVCSLCCGGCGKSPGSDGW